MKEHGDKESKFKLTDTDTIPHDTQEQKEEMPQLT